MCMQKIREAMKSIGNFPRTGIVYVDEFSVGGSEQGKQGRSYDSKKKKVICAVELTLEGKVKLFYAFKIDDYSSKSLRLMFEFEGLALFFRRKSRCREVFLLGASTINPK